MRRIAILLFFPLVFIGSIPYLIYGQVIGRFNRQKGRNIAYSFTRFVSVILMKLAGANYHITGLENYDPTQNYLFVSNHNSLMDIPTLMIMIKEPLSFVSKKEMAKVPILKQWMLLLQCLFLDRTNNREAIKVILKGIDNLKAGDNLAIFPQGTRSKDSSFLPFKQGSFKLAIKAQIPIIPVTIKGTDDNLENNKFNVRPCAIYVDFATPIDVAALSLEEQKNLGKNITTQIKKTYDHLGETV